MVRPIDVTKFRKDMSKALETISFGFNDPQTWISTGCYALNYLISGDFYKGIPLGKVTTLAGESGSGKSYLASGNIVKNAQDQGIYCVLIDSENALDEDWLQRMGVDTSEDKCLRIQAAQIDDVAKIITDFMAQYKANYQDTPKEERPKVLFVVDSLGMLLTPSEIKQFEGGEVSKGDMGRKAKALMALVKNCVIQFSEYEVGLVATNHTYASQDMFDPEDKVSGGRGFIYASSVVITLNKSKLKDKETKEILGIRSLAKVIKTRYSKPFESVSINIPWSKGMDPYSGLFDLFQQKGLIKKDGKMWSYVDLDGVYYKHYEKDWTPDKLEIVMKEFAQREAALEQQAPDTAIIENDTVDANEEV